MNETPSSPSGEVARPRTERELATLGGGCFWCLEAVFEELNGVLSVESGYAGGKVPRPTYAQVCGGGTGHAEVVRIAFDPQTVGFADILRVFFAVHDPTTLNRQGADVGPQYRSVIFYHDETQKETARRYIDQLTREHAYRDPVVTEVAPLTEYYPAEEYHQDYFRRNPDQGYCRMVIAPKLQKFRREFAPGSR